MSSKAKRDAANVARPSTSVSAKRVVRSTRSSNTAGKAKRDATNVARRRTSGSTKKVSTRSSNTASKAKRDATNVARRSTSGSAKKVSKRYMASEAERNADNGAMRVSTAGGTEVEGNGAWTARIQVTAVLKDAAKGLAEFRENVKLINDTIQLALEFWGVIKGIWWGSIIVDLDCGSQEKFFEFQKDFEDGKVKDAMETEFREIGYNGKLELKLMKETTNMAIFEMSKETRIKETKKFFIVNPNPDVVSHGKRKEEKESNQKAEVEENPEGADNPDKEDIQPPSLKRKKASGSTEVKQEKKSGSAAKKPKLDLIGESGTSEVSNTSETGKFKEGVVNDDDLQTLGKAIGGKWDRLARRLPGIKNEEIDGIDETVKKLPDKGYHILNQWKSKDEETANYKTLYNALAHDLVGRKDLAEKYCLKNNIS